MCTTIGSTLLLEALASGSHVFCLARCLALLSKQDLIAYYLYIDRKFAKIATRQGNSQFESAESKSLIFKLGLLSFWGLWHGIVLLTNLCEGLKVLRVLPARWTFASKNYDAIVGATKKYHPATWIPRLLFSGVLIWQLLIFVGFGWAMVASVRSGWIDLEHVSIPFGLSLSLLAAFILVDELCTEYDTEHAHLLFFIAQLLTVIALAVLPR